jgi:hypothetical protein
MLMVPNLFGPNIVMYSLFFLPVGFEQKRLPENDETLFDFG